MKRELLIAGLSVSAVYGQTRVTIGRGRGPGPARPPAIASWEKLGPAEQKKKLEQLPPDRRQKVETQYNNYQKLTPEEQRKLDQSYESFRQLPPEKQAETRQVYKRFAALEKDRRDAVRTEFQAMRELSDDQRVKRLESDDVKQRFTQEERKLLDDLARVSQIPED